MTDKPETAPEPVGLDAAPVGRWDRRAALALAAATLLVLALVAPVAGDQWAAVPVFVPAYQSAVAVNDLVTAALLFAAYREARRPGLLLLGAAYLATAPLVVAHALSFPGLFGPGSLIGGPQTTVWLWLAWHAALPAAAVAYALAAGRKWEPGGAALASERPLPVAVLTSLAFALAAVALTTFGHGRLPALLDGDRYIPGVTRPALAVPLVLALAALALLTLRTRLRRSLDLWLAVAMGAWAVEVLLSAVLNSGRFQAGFYVGRLYGLLASCTVLVSLLFAAAAAHGRLARTTLRQRDAARAALRESEARFRASQELSGVPFCILRAVRGGPGSGSSAGPVADFVFEYANPAAARLLGTAREALEGTRLLRLFPDQAAHPLLFPRYAAVLEGRADGAEVEVAHDGARGIRGWFRNAVVPLDAERVAVSFADVTAQRAADARQRLLFDLGDAARAPRTEAEIVGKAAHALGAHLGAARAAFVRIDEAAGTTSLEGGWTDGTLGDLPAEVRLADFEGRLLRRLRAGETVRADDVLDSPDTADIRPALAAIGVRALISVPLIRDGRLAANLNVHDREPRAWTETEVGLVRAVAERTWETVERARAEEKVRRAAETFAHLVEESPFGIYVVDADFRVSHASRGARAAYGSVDPLVGRDLGEALRLVWPEPFASEAVAQFRRTLEKGEPFQTSDTRERRADRGGAEEAYDWRLERIALADGRPAVVCHFYDLTEQRRLEDELRRLNATLGERTAAAIAERDSAWRNARDVMVVIDTAGAFLAVNPAVTAILGWTEAEMVGRPCFDLIHPDDVGPSEGALAQATAGPLPVFENRYRCKDGGWRTISWVAAPEGDRIYAYGRDVTAEREAARALADAQTQLAHARRMEALGQLAGGIAHDINNVLQAVGGGAALIERKPGDPDAVRRLARMVVEATERGSAVTRRLLAFSRRGDLRAEALDPGVLLADMREILTHTLGAGVGVSVDAAPGLPAMLADKGQLETALVNLATNARDAMGGQGLITLSAKAEARGEDDGHPAGPKLGAYVRVSVADTGVGMAPEVMARATEPFFTTKRVGEGTGLGLAMARGFAEQSGGALLIDSAPGRGTTVSLFLPIAPASAAPPASPGETAPAGPRGGQDRWRVLLVDDDAPVREITAEGLEAAGLAVVAAPDGASALALLDAGEAVDLVVSDYSMPGMDGVALIREAQRRRPGLPAILLTGFATNAAELAIGGAVSGAFSLLRKPVAAAQVAERVAVLLEGMKTAGRL